MVLPIALWHAAYLETDRCHATDSSLLPLTAICTKPAFFIELAFKGDIHKEICAIRLISCRIL